MHVVSFGRVVALAFLAIAGAAACRHAPGPLPGLVAPTVRVGVGNLSESERQRVRRFERALRAQ